VLEVFEPYVMRQIVLCNEAIAIEFGQDVIAHLLADPEKSAVAIAPTTTRVEL